MKRTTWSKLFAVLALLGSTAALHAQESPVERVNRIELQDLEVFDSSGRLPAYRIDRGRHSPHQRRIRLHRSREFAIRCRFDTSCLYLAADHINKIFGYSFGWNHHRNSFRIGWRCSGDRIEVVAYWYLRGSSSYEHLFYIEPEEAFSLHAVIGQEVAQLSYRVGQDSWQGQQVLYNPEKKPLRNWGYVNYPYFGGREKAPHPMVVYLKAWIGP